MFLAEKDISPQLVAVDLAAGEQHGEAYRAINPRRVVPTVVLVNGTAIGEVLAIWRFLEEAYPAVPLLGTTPKDKTLVTMSEQRAEFEGFAAVMEGVRNAAPRLGRAIAGPHDYAQTPALVERNKLRVTNFYSDIEARLAKAPFVAGAHFSAADITTLVTIDFATRASFAIATSPAVGYCVRTGAGCWYDREPERLEPGQPERTVLVDDAYIEAQAPTVRDRLARAGVRLDGLLNNSLDPHDK